MSKTKRGLTIEEIKNKKGSESLQILNEIDFLITNASTVPLTSKVMVDAEYLFSLVDKFRQVFPEELEQAEMVINEVQEIADEAEAEAEKIIADAQNQANAILNESRILREAQVKASMLINEAMLGREQMQKEAEEFVYHLFADAENKLMNNVFAVKQALSTIKNPQQ